MTRLAVILASLPAVLLLIALVRPRRVISTTRDGALEALKQLQEWSKWMAGIQTAAFGALALLAFNKDEGALRDLNDVQTTLAMGGFVYLGAALFCSAWVLSALPSHTIRIFHYPTVGNRASHYDIYEQPLFAWSKRITLAFMLSTKHWLWAIGLLSVAGYCLAMLVGSPDVSMVHAHLQDRIRTRKVAANTGDSTTWLTAADLHPNATCVDATGARRACRPDFANPSTWQQRSALDSFAVLQLGNVAVVTYRETDTVYVAGNTAVGQARYVETYRHQNGRWQLVALSEASIPGARSAMRVPVSTLRPLVGSYGDDRYALHVTLRNDTLYVAATGEAASALLALSPTQYFAHGDIGTYEFVMSTPAQASELRYHHQGKTYRFTRRGT